MKLDTSIIYKGFERRRFSLEHEKMDTTKKVALKPISISVPKYNIKFKENLTPLYASIESLSKNLNHVQQTMQENIKKILEFSEYVNKVIAASLAPLREINWDELEKGWLNMAEGLAIKGWTTPLNMDVDRMFELAAIKKQYKVDKAFIEFYADKDNFKELKDTLLEHKLLNEWNGLLKQCLENYEKGNYLIVIPSLFTIIEGFAHKLIFPRFKISDKTDENISLSRKYETVRSEVLEDSVTLAYYASAQVFIRMAFKFAGFDKEDARRPFLINRNWVLHGRDNPSLWKRVDALRLFNAISTLTVLDFLLEE
jgi:hypothetical protein